MRERGSRDSRPGARRRRSSSTNSPPRFHRPPSAPVSAGGRCTRSKIEFGSPSGADRRGEGLDADIDAFVGRIQGHCLVLASLTLRHKIIKADHRPTCLLAEVRQGSSGTRQERVARRSRTTPIPGVLSSHPTDGWSPTATCPTDILPWTPLVLARGVQSVTSVCSALARALAAAGLVPIIEERLIAWA